MADEAKPAAALEVEEKVTVEELDRRVKSLEEEVKRLGRLVHSLGGMPH